MMFASSPDPVLVWDDLVLRLDGVAGNSRRCVHDELSQMLASRKRGNGPKATPAPLVKADKINIMLKTFAGPIGLQIEIPVSYVILIILVFLAILVLIILPIVKALRKSGNNVPTNQQKSFSSISIALLIAAIVLIFIFVFINLYY